MSTYSPDRKSPGRVLASPAKSLRSEFPDPSTVVGFAALHATIARHQAGHREVETGAAESAAAATHCANENNEIEVQTVR